MIGDTDFFIELMRRRSPHHADAVAKVRALEERGTRIVMTAVTRFELSTGVAGSTAPEQERRKVLRAIESYPTLPLDGPSADRAGKIHGELRARGDGVPADDAMIAGIALQFEEPLLTRDRAHFRRVEGLVLEPYLRRPARATFPIVRRTGGPSPRSGRHRSTRARAAGP